MSMIVKNLECVCVCMLQLVRGKNLPKNLTREVCLQLASCNDNSLGFAWYQGKSVCCTAIHTNHHLDLNVCKHLPLPKAVIETVKTMFACGVEMKTILDDMKYIRLCVLEGWGVG